MSNKWLPDAHFGHVGKPLPKITAGNADPDPDDEEMEKTPSDVKHMLGFDPKSILKKGTKK